MRKLGSNWLLAPIIVLYCLARWKLLSQLHSPVFGWRPSDMAGIALGYYRHGFQLWYPRVLWGASGPGYVEMEFPLAPFLTAIFFKAFGPHEWVNLIVSEGCGIGLVCAVYAFARHLFGAAVALASAVVVAMSPTLIMLTDTGMWADPPMVLCGTLGLYWLTLWSERASNAWLWAGSAAVALAILLKLPALYLGIPVGYLILERYGLSCWKAPVVWLAALGMLLPALIWYWHANQLFKEYHNTFGILGSGYLKFGSSDLLLHAPFYLGTARRVALYHLTPIGTLGFLWGLFLLLRKAALTEGRRGLLLAWLGSVVLFALVAAGGVASGHYHYLLPLLPIAALISGFGAVSLIERLASAAARLHRWGHGAVLGAVALLFIANASYAAERFQSRDRKFDNWTWQEKKRTGELLEPLLGPEALLIVCDTQMDEVTPATSMTPPDVFYFSGGHRGWYISMAWLRPESIEALRAQGATHFVVSGQSVADFKRARKDMLEYLEQRYPTILDNEDGLAFALTKAAR